MSSNTAVEDKSLIPNIPATDFNPVVQKLRNYCLEQGMLEVHPQNRLSILAACEDPSTIQTFNYHNNVWPLPQTNQMWLEHDLLENPTLPGLFCTSTSYRNEPNPQPGRHNLIFPMFEFEIKGGFDDLIKWEKGLLEYLGYPKTNFGKSVQDYPEGNYLELAKKYDTYELEHEHEAKLYEEYGSSYLLKNFPEYSSPFWNMKREGTISKKIDVILSGQETIGSAERSSDKEEMKKRFDTISNGGYAKLIYNKFGKERVDKEMEKFLSFDFFPRSGGGIGISRLIRSMKMEKLI